MANTGKHLVVDYPLRGDDARWNIATVENGEYLDEIVCIIVQFSDNWCICDLGSEKPLVFIKIEDLRLWVSVESTGNIRK